MINSILRIESPRLFFLLGTSWQAHFDTGVSCTKSNEESEEKLSLARNFQHLFLAGLIVLVTANDLLLLCSVSINELL